MQDPLTDPISSFLLRIAIGGAVGLVGKIMIGRRSSSPYVLLGIAGALVGAKIGEVYEAIPSVGPLVGAVFGAIFFVIGWRQMQPP
jgi:uncharacterized membrane protein YeaQ/YmgE (transglycosylase-associated protein family)